MSTALAQAHITAQAKLRALTVAGIDAAWTKLAAYDEENVDQWLARILPLVAAAQAQSVALTNAFVARSIGRQPFALPVAELTGAAIRCGSTPADVYRRPFVTVWTDLAAGRPYDQALEAGRARAASTAAMDVQLSMRATLVAAGAADRKIAGYQRVADPGACKFCLAVNGAKVAKADPMPLHNGCGCGVDVLTRPFTPDVPPAEDVAVHQHGELGPVLGDPAHNFDAL